MKDPYLVMSNQIYHLKSQQAFSTRNDWNFCLIAWRSSFPTIWKFIVKNWSHPNNISVHKIIAKLNCNTILMICSNLHFIVRQ